MMVQSRQNLAFKSFVLSLALVAALLVGCSAQATPERTGAGAGSSYAGALDTSYAGALDVPSQLALGTLRLEETADAVTSEQAAALLPLWQGLQGTVARTESERSAVLRQIESTMSEAQLAAVAGMRLTVEDVRTWAQTQAGGFAAPGGQGQWGRQNPGGGQGGGGQAQGGAGPQMSDEARATRRAQFQNQSPEELATRRAQFGQGGAGSAGAGRPTQAGNVSSGPVTAVIALLRERSGMAGVPPVARQRPSATATATEERAEAWTPTVVPATPHSDEPTPTVPATPTATPTTAAAAVGPSATPTVVRAAAQPTVARPVQATYDSPALEQLPDTDPGPPLAVEVSANRAYPDPLVEKSRRYLVSGIVRNAGSEPYALSALHVTFFDAEGFRGSYRRFPGPYNMGGEWIRHGRTEADVSCLLLAPGEACPFLVEITAQDMASFLVHPDALKTERQSAPLEASGLRLARDGTEYVTLSGQVTNTHPFKIKNIVLSGVLLDAAGETVGLGSAYVIAEGVEPGQVVDFEIRIHDSAYGVGTPFLSYRVYAQAERDLG